MYSAIEELSPQQFVWNRVGFACRRAVGRKQCHLSSKSPMQPKIDGVVVADYGTTENSELLRKSKNLLSELRGFGSGTLSKGDTKQ
jgi:hypothetical protein